MKRLAFIIALVLVFAADETVAANAQLLAKNMMCPVMIGEKAKDKFFIDYQDRRIYFCCRNCIKSFKRDPKRYLKNLSEEANPT